MQVYGRLILVALASLGAGCLPGVGQCCRRQSDCDVNLVCVLDGGAQACDAACFQDDGSAPDGGAARTGTCQAQPWEGNVATDLSMGPDLTVR
jgi:hypothetical protein